MCNWIPVSSGAFNPLDVTDALNIGIRGQLGFSGISVEVFVSDIASSHEKPRESPDESDALRHRFGESCSLVVRHVFERQSSSM